MMLQKSYYVYVWFRRNDVPCYVGKGHGDRWKQHLTRSKNRHLSNILAKEKKQMRAEIVANQLTESEAFELEMLLISVIGRRQHGGPLVNSTDGGEGTSGYKHVNRRMRKHSQEHKDKIAASLIGGKRTPEQRAKMSAWQIGRKMSPESRVKMREAAIRRCSNPDYLEKLSRAGKAGAASRWSKQVI